MRRRRKPTSARAAFDLQPWLHNIEHEQIPNPEPSVLENFLSDMMRIWLTYRNQRDGAGAFDNFKAAVDDLVELYRRKGLGVSMLSQIEGVAARALERARKVGL